MKPLGRIKASNMSRALFFGLLVISIQGCSMEASIESLGESVSEIFSAKSTSRDVTPGSQQNVITGSGYQVQGSVDFYEGAGQIKTSGGYKVQTNLQSTLFREIR